MRIPLFGPALDGIGDTRQSDVWKHGWRVIHKQDQKLYWLCKVCHLKKSHSQHAYQISHGLTGPRRHLARPPHSTNLLNKRRIDAIISSSNSRESTPSTTSLRSGLHAYYNEFHPHEFKALLLEWIVQDNTAFQALESPRLQRILTYLNPAVDRRGCLPVHKTVKRWITAVYDSHIGVVTEALATAVTKVHISFDLWTSRSLIAFCGINVHFLDNESNYRTFLLALPRHFGTHKGINVADTISATITVTV
jgi:hypothetical protein